MFRSPASPCFPRILLGAALALALAAPAIHADEAQDWVEKAIAPFEQAPFQLKFSVSMNIDQGQTEVTMSSEGTFLYLDPRHSVTEMQTSMKAGNAPAQSSTSHTIADGEDSWAFSVPSGESKPPQIMRSNLDELEARAASEGSVLAVSGDPYSQFRSMAARVNFELVETTATTVKLEGGFSSDLPPTLAAQLQIFGASPRLSLEVDKATGEPRAMQLGPKGSPVLSVTFGQVNYLSKNNVPKSSFKFQPPNAVPIFSP